MGGQPPCVLGGGVIGLTCAFYLGRAGLKVTVLERDRLGSGASRGNAGEVCPDLVEPLGAPGVAAKALSGLFRPESPLWINPVPNVRLLRFLARLGLNSTARRYDAGVASLAALAEDTFALFEELEALGVDGGAEKDGFLFAYASYEAAAHGVAAFRRLGAPVATEGVLAASALAEAEPTLGPAARAGFLVERQWSLDPGRFVDSLAERLRRRCRAGGGRARVTAVREGAGRVEVRTTAGTYGTDQVVVASGVWSREICRSLGVDIDLAPGKGYSSKVRVAGTMEFDRDPDHFRQSRVDVIVAAARPYLPEADWDHREQEWMGPRPMTTDGLPLIGPLPGHPGVVLATGHNMLGLMPAPVTGRLVTGLLVGKPDDSLTPGFAPGRAVRRGLGPSAGRV
ncbi:NAD(P)/FAD-dependent oxidoreductase [Streptomyces mirabilis]|uniref:NAD(P)/FAD-dependent oxidoreductase n=1 Tax=Streptomyces mirabilis TaxID=68239 RepID=UPI003662B80D